MNLGLGPHEQPGIDVIGDAEGVDVAVERSARERLGRQDQELDFRFDEPGCFCRRELEMDVRVALQPADVLGLVGVVEMTWISPPVCSATIQLAFVPAPADLAGQPRLRPRTKWSSRGAHNRGTARSAPGRSAVSG